MGINLTIYICLKNKFQAIMQMFLMFPMCLIPLNFKLNNRHMNQRSQHSLHK